MHVYKFLAILVNLSLQICTSAHYLLSDVIVPDAMIKDDWTDRPDKDSDEEDSTQVGQWSQHQGVKLSTLYTTMNLTLPEVSRVCDFDLIVFDKEFF